MLVTKEGNNIKDIALGRLVMTVNNARPTVWRPTPVAPLSIPERSKAPKIAVAVKVSNT